MIKTLTGSQRYNNRMDKVWESAIKAKQEHCEHKFFLVQDSFSMQKYHRECAICGKKSATTKYKLV